MNKKLFSFCFFLLCFCLFLTGCKSQDYKNALELENSKDYAGAAKIYQTITDYKDSQQRLDICNNMLKITDDFNNAVSSAEKNNEELNNAIINAEDLIKRDESALDVTLIPTLETAISDGKAAKITIPDLPETEEEIITVTNNLNKIDYTNVIKNISDKQLLLENSIKQYALVNAPSEAYIISRLKGLPNIIDISAVTEDNDPNGNLNKPGGYTAQVYFSSDLVDPDEVSGTTVIEKGTDGGGSIEVYKTEEEANKRKDYLASYDGGILATGTHTVIGTVLVRTSDKLKASQQIKMESNIIDALTKLDS